MFKVIETENSKTMASYELDTKDKAIAFMHKLVWDYIDYYGRLDGDLDNVVDNYTMATKENPFASVDIDNRHWTAKLAETN